MKDILTNTDFADLIQVLRWQYGYDFTGYAQPSLKRRIMRFMGNMHIDTVFELKHRAINERPFFEKLVEFMTVNVTEMFRDPEFYQVLRTDILPMLATYPIIKIWHAGCSTGEEAFSMAILLHEAGLLKRARLYATDLNPVNLEKAESGIIPVEAIREYTHNYILAGGKNDFSDYYTARYDNALLRKDLRRQITFFQHNLVTDGVFNEFHLVCCRNVFIYFNRGLQERVLQLFHDSLPPRGYLALGIKESIRFTEGRQHFETVNSQYKIYRRNI